MFIATSRCESNLFSLPHHKMYTSFLLFLQVCVLDDGSTETFQRNNNENVPSDGSDLSANNYASSESDSSFDEEIASETEERESPEGAASSSKRKRSQSIKARKSVSFSLVNLVASAPWTSLRSNCLASICDLFFFCAGADEGMP